MLLDDWNQEEYVEVMREEAREEGLEQGREEGREEGRNEGREEGLKEEKQIIAKNLLAKGSTLEFVQEITGLSPEQIAAL